MKKTALALIGAAMLLALPMVVSAQGIIGDCADCHTMHNSEQGQPVAQQGLSGTLSATPNTNLLRMDCIACHAQDVDGPKIAAMSGGSRVPQVYHSDNTGDLAAGNFKYVIDDGPRKGHNVTDLTTNDPDNGANAPGDIRNSSSGHDFANFTCAGAKGCHGTRSQALASTPTADPLVNLIIERVGMAAISGAHHNNYDGEKDPTQITPATAVHDGQHVADSYRFLRGLKGFGNDASDNDRWQNVDATSHNEYYGSIARIDDPLNPAYTGTGCNRCHVPGDATTGRSARFAQNSTLAIPNQSMSGFCSTCHGNFHSSGGNDFYGGPGNGVSGAFLRHPSDYVIPGTGEYAAYTSYDITAPVARQTLATAVSATVEPGSDMVMCLSCHMAHGSEYDGMLRFDYSVMTAGFYDNTADAQAAGGCLACHTTKGVLPENR